MYDAGMQTIAEPSRSIPVLATADVIIAGGGVSGCLAAVAAARAGARVVLVERYGYLGGLVTGWPVPLLFNCFPAEGPGDPQTYAVQGVTRDMLDRLQRHPGGWKPWPTCDGTVDWMRLTVVLQEMLDEAGVAVFFDSWISGIVGEPGRRVDGIVVETKSGRAALLGTVTVDATADGDVAAAAGATEKRKCSQRHSLAGWVTDIDVFHYQLFKERQKEAWESLATVRHDGICHQVDLKCDMSDLPPATLLCWAHATGDAVDARHLSRMQSDCRKRLFETVDRWRAEMPGWRNARIFHTSPQFGVRQGRSGLGSYTITVADLKEGHRHADEVAVVRWWGPRHPYAIPWRSLVPRAVDGLIFSSRLVDADTGALGTLRLLGACFAMAHAAGAGAAVAVRQGRSPRQVDAQAVRSLLREQHAWLPEPEETPAGVAAGPACDIQGEH
jgi:hypothetical protein